MSGAQRANHDDDEPRKTEAGRRASVVVTGLLVAAVAGCGAAVMATFIIGLGQQASAVDVGIVVVGDPSPRQDPAPMRIVAVGTDRVLPVTGTINGVPINADGLVDVATGGGRLEVVADVLWRQHHEHLTLDFPLPDTHLSTTLTTTQAPRVLLSSAAGPGVYPFDGVVPARGAASVLLLDDHEARVVVVDAAVDGRLPDGRLLALDRAPVQASLTVSAPAGIAVAVLARRATPVLISVVVGGRVLALRHLSLADGEARTVAFAWPGWQRPGDVVVVGIATTWVPGQAAISPLQLVNRVGGFVDDDLLAVDARARPFLDRPEVRQALGRRLRVAGGEPAIVSPTMARQRQQRVGLLTEAATRSRHQFRLAAGTLALVVLLNGLWWRGRPALVLVGLAVVIGSLMGLDAMLGVVNDNGAVVDIGNDPGDGPISGSP